MKIIACVDGSIYSESVADHAAWAARQLSAPVELLQVLGRRDTPVTDYSGNITAEAQASLLAKLAAIDAERARLVFEHGRLVMEQVRGRLVSQGLPDVTITLRHGDLLEAISEREATANLIVIGKRGEAADFARLHLGSNLERVVRASHRPILVASRAFKPITRALIAFDGGPSATKAIDHAAQSPLFAAVAIQVVTVGKDDAETRGRLDAAAARLSAKGLAVDTRIVPGIPDKAIASMVEANGIDLLVMGAYGHSRIRNLIIGSTTSEMIRSCKVPVLLFR
jgi:nucleotide-binding universal stress UspA family protein